MSIATLSNLEAKDGPRMNDVIISVSEQLGIDSMHFSMPSEEFAEKIHILLPDDVSPEALGKLQSKKGSINQLLNRLTMNFAEKMFDKSLKKGDKIESDRVLATNLGDGRSAVREALKVLDVLGMIDIRPGQGTYISGNEANFFVIPLSWSLFMNGNQTESILEVRDLLEVKAAYLAAGCVDDPSYIAEFADREWYRFLSWWIFRKDPVSLFDLGGEASIEEAVQGKAGSSVLRQKENRFAVPFSW